jgi:putative membrane protein
MTKKPGHNEPSQSAPLGRRPTAFTVDAEPSRRATGPAAGDRRAPQSFSGEIEIVPDDRDPFLGDVTELAAPSVATSRRRGLSFARIAMGAFGILLSLALGLWVDRLIRDLFSRADWLGYTAIAVLSIGLLALVIAIGRELIGLYRLDAVQNLKADAEAAAASGKRAKAMNVVHRLSSLVAHRPETARGRKTLESVEDDIIDAPQLIDLAERELLAPLDSKARALILGSAKRVSVVTAVSPRAVVDLAYVLFEVVRLVRAMAELYGGRPGSFGMLRLLKDVFAHLAVTGSIAIGDGLAQQVLGHGLAARLSSRLGEGVINGLMTARIGIAAMDLCRPLPFHATRRPGIGDFIGDLTPSMTGKSDDRTS